MACMKKNHSSCLLPPQSSFFLVENIFVQAQRLVSRKLLQRPEISRITILLHHDDILAYQANKETLPILMGLHFFEVAYSNEFLSSLDSQRSYHRIQTSHQPPLQCTIGLYTYIYHMNRKEIIDQSSQDRENTEGELLTSREREIVIFISMMRLSQVYESFL